MTCGSALAWRIILEVKSSSSSVPSTRTRTEIYLLDTNRCSLLMEGEAAVQEKMRRNKDNLVATCVFVEAELLYMAHYSQKQAANLTRVQNFLDAISVHSLDTQAIREYAHLKADVMRHFGPKEKSKRRHFTLSQLGVSDNDLWIAAIALRHNLTIVSADTDFRRLQEVRPLRVETWLTA